jgi:hypothetical protein
MKNSFMPMALFLTSATVFAGASDIAPSPDTISPSTVEHIYNLQKETFEQPAIRLVQVDNGGSTDISSAIQPSRLYLGLHQDGEEFDVDGNYLLTDSVVEVLSARMKSRTEIALKLKVKELVEDQNGNERVRKSTKTYTVLLQDALHEAATAHGDETSDGITLKSTVGLKNGNP